MKKSIVFILGILTGILLTVVFAVIYSHHLESDPENDPRITYFDTPSAFTASDKYEVFQVLPNGALARSEDFVVVYILANGQNTFYNDQIIRITSENKAVQIGTFKYKSKLGERVVPVIEIQHSSSTQSEELYTQNKEETDGEITYATKPSPFSVSNKFKVKKVLEHGVVAQCRDKQYSPIEIYDDPLIYIPADGQNMYYTDQIISIPSGKKAVQVGTIKLKEHYYSNVLPIIEFK